MVAENQGEVAEKVAEKGGLRLPCALAHLLRKENRCGTIRSERKDRDMKRIETRVSRLNEEPKCGPGSSPRNIRPTAV